MTVAVRVIPCLDVDAGRVVKGVNFVNLRDAGDPVELGAAYDAAGADELVFLDVTASSDGRATMLDVVRTRMYIRDRADASAVTAAHAEFFGSVRPVTALYVVAGFLDPDHLVEVEVEAYKP